MTASTWTEHETFLSETIACRVKIGRDDQIRETWSHAPCGRPPFSFREALARLAWAIESYTVNLHPPLYPMRPVLRLRPGEAIPADLRPHSELLRRRWSQAAVPTKVFVATQKAANLYGSRAGGLPPIGHRDHEVLLTDAFVYHLKSEPSTIHHWVGEQMLNKAGFRLKDPDALLVDEDGMPYGIVESGGAYSAQQLEGLCEFAFERGLELEVW